MATKARTCYILPRQLYAERSVRLWGNSEQSPKPKGDHPAVWLSIDGSVIDGVATLRALGKNGVRFHVTDLQTFAEIFAFRTLNNIKDARERRIRRDDPKVAAARTAYRQPAFIVVERSKLGPALEGMRATKGHLPPREHTHRDVIDLVVQLARKAKAALGRTAPQRKGWRHMDWRDYPKWDRLTGKVGLVIADPPFHLEHLHWHEKAAEHAKKILMPGRCLAAYCGTLYLDERYRLMSKHLTYWVTLFEIFRAGSKPDLAVNFFNRVRPILIYTKGEPSLSLQGVLDLMNKKSKKQKELHDWQQSLEGMTYVVDKFSQPGELVVDLFGGSATAGEACLRTGRKYLGFEIDEERYSIGKHRLREVAAELK